MAEGGAPNRTGEMVRTTKETQIRVAVDLDGVGVSNVATGIGFFDHMLDAFARHAGIDVTVEATGDLCQQVEHLLAVEEVRDRFRPTQAIGTSVFCCVDSISTRGAIARSVLGRCRFWGNGRMLGEVVRVLAVAREGRGPQSGDPCGGAARAPFRSA